MKRNITEEDIIRSAQRLRDMDNDTLSVRHLPTSHRSKLVKYTVVGTAAVVGFIAGFFLSPNRTNTSSLMAHVDTVYVQNATLDSAIHSSRTILDETSTPEEMHEKTIQRHFRRQENNVREAEIVVPSHAESCSVSEDNIDYSLMADR